MSPSDIAKARALLTPIYGAAFVATLDDRKVAMLAASLARHPSGAACTDARGPAPIAKEPAHV